MPILSVVSQKCAIGKGVSTYPVVTNAAGNAVFSIYLRAPQAITFAYLLNDASLSLSGGA
jgi:hypothetical protein